MGLYSGFFLQFNDVIPHKQIKWYKSQHMVTRAENFVLAVKRRVNIV